MEKSLFFKKVKEQQDVKFRKKVYVFFICLILSTIFWLLIKLSKEYIISMTFPVQYVNIPDKKIIGNEVETQIELKLKMDGFNVLKSKLFNKPTPLKISINKLNKKNIAGKDYYYINTSQIIDDLDRQIEFNAKVIGIKPDTFQFLLEKKCIKKVPVRLQSNVTFKKQYNQYGDAIVKPDSIVIWSKKEILDTIQFVNTVLFSHKNLNKSVEEVVPLNIESSYRIIPEYNKVLVTLPVEKYTETSLEIPITTTYPNFKYKIKTFPEKVKVSFLVAIKDFKKIQVADFVAVVDINQILKGEHTNKLKVSIGKQPTLTKILSIEPDKVEYIIIK